ncbi:MAG TPA: gamma carbonic anhydrase family protein [Clostridiales bacterium]|nr:gamma carbonic anhydrase family protein [Clostridiales bacterium]
MLLLSYADKTPTIEDSCFLADGCAVIGDVILAKNVSLWFNVVLRGDVDRIVVGANSNIQDNATLHCSAGKPVSIGKNVSVGHNAVVHGATVGDNVLIGIGAILLDGAIIGANSIIAAGAVVTENKVIPENALVMGIPGKVVATLNDAERQSNLDRAARYVKLAREYKTSR